jgi:hypothetical protein
MYKEKVLGDSTILKGDRVTIPTRVREKLSVKVLDLIVLYHKLLYWHYENEKQYI